MFCALGLVFDGTEGVGFRFHVLCSRTHFQRYLGRPVPFSCFVLPDSFSAVPRVSGPVFKFCTPRHVFGGSEGVRSRYHVLRSLTRYQRYEGRRVLFSCFVCPDSFSAETRVPGPTFMFSAPGVVSCFHVLRSRTRFLRYRGHRVPFSCFARPDSFSAVSRVPAPVFMFCTTRLIFGDTEGVGSRFHVLRAQTHFRWSRGRLVLFSCFALLDMFSAVPIASGPVFLFCTHRLVFGVTDGVGSRFHVLRSRTRFWRNGWRRVLFSFFACPESFSTVQRVPGLVFMFCAPRLIFGGTEGVDSRFHVLRIRTRFRRYRGRRVPFSCFARPDSISAVPRASGTVFMFCSPGLIFGGTEGVRSCFHVLLSRTCFRRSRRRRVPFSCFTLSDMFSCFALPDMFSAVPRSSGPVFKFCAAEHVFSGTEGVGFRFHVLCALTRFRWKRGCRVPFSCFALPESFPTIPRASGPVLMFCSLGHVFDSPEGVRSRLHVLRSRTCF
jgi:hypothetical protein